MYRRGRDAQRPLPLFPLWGQVLAGTARIPAEHPWALLPALPAAALARFLRRLAGGAADPAVRVLEHKAARRWPGLRTPGPGPASGAGPGPGTANRFRGKAGGPVVQAGHIGEVHVHPPPPEREPDP